MSSVTVMDENGHEIKSPMKRVGSTRKILIFNSIRQQLNEQLRCLDIRVESQVSLVQELQDFFRRRAELEMEYSRSLDKFARSILLRHKEQKQKREQWPLFSTYGCWQHLINQTQALSKNHATLADIYLENIVTNLQTVLEDVQRLYKKCRAIGYEIHEEILRVLQELHATMKTYQRYEGECKAAEIKLVSAETQRIKLQQIMPSDKLARSKKYKLIEKELIKRKTKYADARLKALKAKNEYNLCLEASNTSIHKYFVEDLSDLIDCMDLGFGSMISRAILMHVSADQGRSRAILHQADGLSQILHSIDSRADKQKFLEQHHAAFMIPKRFEFQAQINNEQIDFDIQKSLYFDMEQRLHMLEQRLSTLRTESDEIWKTLETAEVKLLEYFNTADYDTSELFNGNSQYYVKSAAMNTSPKTKADKQEIEDFYISKIREYVKGTSRIARLDAKAQYLRNILMDGDNSILSTHDKSVVMKRKRIGRKNICGQPKLFGGSLEEYLECTGEEIPLIMKSCIRVINLYGLHHQGIFRVSGSQVEIANFRDMFEKGEDPLADTNDASDINSVAGVLKLYVRELREPLFPIIYFDYLISIAEIRNKDEMIMQIKKFLQSLPRSVIIVIRYLFAFLHHLSEYADENMMDAYNLAICFGPTLMPAPEDKDQVQYQNQINELIKNMIVYHEELFPKDLEGLEYEKYISNEPFIDIDVGDSPNEVLSEDPDSEVYPSEDESEILEAIAQFDFNARSCRELTLRKGETVILKKQVSNDWWQGTCSGKDGLIPDKYISFKIKDDDREKNIETAIEICKRDEAQNLFLQETKGLETNTSDELSLDDFQQNCLYSDSNSEVQMPINLVCLDNMTDNKNDFAYHDEAHSFENAVEFRNNLEKSEETFCHSSEQIESKSATAKSETYKLVVNMSNKHLAKVNTMSPMEENDNVSVAIDTKMNLSPIQIDTEQICELKATSKFQESKRLWEKLTSATYNHQQPSSYTTTPTAPDLVLDLPLLMKNESQRSSKTTNQIENIDSEEIGSAETFALQNQSTLKKNEKIRSLSNIPHDKESKKIIGTSITISSMQKQILPGEPTQVSTSQNGSARLLSFRPQESVQLLNISDPIHDLGSEPITGLRKSK